MIPALTGLLYVSVYNYKWGIFAYYNIPGRLIKIGIEDLLNIHTLLNHILVIPIIIIGSWAYLHFHHRQNIFLAYPVIFILLSIIINIRFLLEITHPIVKFLFFTSCLTLIWFVLISSLLMWFENIFEIFKKPIFQSETYSISVGRFIIHTFYISIALFGYMKFCYSLGLKYAENSNVTLTADYKGKEYQVIDNANFLILLDKHSIKTEQSEFLMIEKSDFQSTLSYQRNKSWLEKVID